ncbi:MAG: 4-amino-4-deoxy-L-arabinose-phospho-UDP flippase [Alphaproteobacteria bacterium]|jgi:drug/metabolite transporter (DMT)-like permease|nr:MAG: 4-amino-4-deoxy-L-arabinose-phospho-UDP flippase [Alphaproteobacteria bacterium]TMJ51143.1 MAG: 4-amino-4-deoxy-L-arabinose-phospho-UDP flippase [Alphaproteobacteria bacterium]
MSERLSIAQIAILCGYAAGMAAGQILFKLASLRLAADASLFERAASLLQNWLFLAALAVYLALSVLWVWILSFTPLSRAYLFVALSFAIVPVAGTLLFAEPMSPRLMIGIGLILCGLLFVAG